MFFDILDSKFQAFYKNYQSNIKHFGLSSSWDNTVLTEIINAQRDVSRWLERNLLNSYFKVQFDSLLTNWSAEFFQKFGSLIVKQDLANFNTLFFIKKKWEIFSFEAVHSYFYSMCVPNINKYVCSATLFDDQNTKIFLRYELIVHQDKIKFVESKKEGEDWSREPSDSVSFFEGMNSIVGIDHGIQYSNSLSMIKNDHFQWIDPNTDWNRIRRIVLNNLNDSERKQVVPYVDFDQIEEIDISGLSPELRKLISDLESHSKLNRSDIREITNLTVKNPENTIVNVKSWIKNSKLGIEEKRQLMTIASNSETDIFIEEEVLKENLKEAASNSETDIVIEEEVLKKKAENEKVEKDNAENEKAENEKVEKDNAENEKVKNEKGKVGDFILSP